MSQHPSLLGSQKGKRHRSVLKRYEKLKHLIEKDKWTEESSIYSLPKVKSVKFKVKKEKTAATTEGQAAVTPAAPGQAGAAQPQAGAVKSGAGAAKSAPEKHASGLAARQAPAKDKKAKA